MNVLTERDILHIWEAGQNRPLWFRAMLILSYALPDMNKEQLADLTIGQRNFCLLKIRRNMVGADIDSCVHCPECNAPLEFKMDVDSICGILPRETAVRRFSISIEGMDLWFKPLTSRDLAAFSQGSEPEEARLILLKRCVSKVEKNGAAVDIDGLPQSVVEELGEKIAETYDPQIEIKFRMQCAACGHSWTACFDIVSFFWTEIDAQAQRLLHEVHVLARTYGWSETDIWAMNSARKNYYLQLVS